MRQSGKCDLARALSIPAPTCVTARPAPRNRIHQRGERFNDGGRYPVTTISSTGATIPQPGGAKPGVAGLLQTQLSRYQVKLADWCSCPGGKTPEGKRIIADLQQKADAIKAQLQQIDAAPSRQSAAPAAPPPPQDGRSSAVRSRIDVYA